MKIKKLLTICICLLCLIAFVGCTKDGPKTKAINIDRYFSSQVQSKYGNNASMNENLKLSSFTGQNVDVSTLKNRSSIIFTGETSWIYGMYIECIYVTFYCNKDIEINQLRCTITDLDSGETDSTLPENTHKQTTVLSGNVKRNTGYEFKVKVNKTALNSELTLTFALEDNVDQSFEWTLYNFRVHGETR